MAFILCTDYFSIFSTTSRENFPSTFRRHSLPKSVHFFTFSNIRTKCWSHSRSPPLFNKNLYILKHFVVKKSNDSQNFSYENNVQIHPQPRSAKNNPHIPEIIDSNTVVGTAVNNFFPISKTCRNKNNLYTFCRIVNRFFTQFE